MHRARSRGAYAGSSPRWRTAESASPVERGFAPDGGASNGIAIPKSQRPGHKFQDRARAAVGFTSLPECTKRSPKSIAAITRACNADRGHSGSSESAGGGKKARIVAAPSGQPDRHSSRALGWIAINTEFVCWRGGSNPQPKPNREEHHAEWDARAADNPATTEPPQKNTKVVIHAPP